MKQQFSTLKQRTVTYVVPFTKEQFFEMMYSEKPTEIYNGHWSTKKPFVVITEYNENGMLLYCNGLADKTPEQKTIEQLYDFLKYQGLSECYILTGALAGKAIEANVSVVVVSGDNSPQNLVRIVNLK